MKNKNYTKINSGIFKGFKIKIFNKKVKPTLNIIRKTLFDWLRFFIKNKKCIDCFGGSGILSLEALSNKALHTTIIEKNYKTYKTIKNNFKIINKKKYKIYNTDVLRWIKKNNSKYDLIFIDPPYHNNYINKIIYLIEKKITKKKTFIYIETYKKNNNLIIPHEWILYKKKYTQISKHLLYMKK